MSEETAEEEIVEEPVEEASDMDLETKFFPEEQAEKTEEKPKLSVKTDKMTATIGNQSTVKEKAPKKTSKLFNLFHISITKK